MNASSKALILTLMLGGELCTAAAKRIARPAPTPFVSNFPAISTEVVMPTVRLKPFANLASAHAAMVSNMPKRMYRGYYHSCGFGTIGPNHFAPRVTKLPTDHLGVLAGAYLKCETINVGLIEPRVRVDSYPPGYFGEYEYEGLLVSDRLEFSDETVLHQLFTLLIEVAGESDEELETYFYFSDHPDAKLANYRTETRFTPELVFELTGETTVRVEINLTSERVVIQENDHWDSYKLDQWSAAALKKIVTDEQINRHAPPTTTREVSF